MKRIIVGITGASGSVLAKRAVEELLSKGHEVHIIFSAQGEKVFPFELDMSIESWLNSLEHLPGRVIAHDNENMFSRLASGSYSVDGTLVIPCSVGTISRVAQGNSETLLTRVCDVAIKEQRKLVMVIRETPLSSIHLENMLKLSRTGVIIMPPVPPYYHKPKTLEESVDLSVGRILRLLGVDSGLHEEWCDPNDQL